MAEELIPDQLVKVQEALILLSNLPLSGVGGGGSSSSEIAVSAPESALAEGIVIKIKPEEHYTAYSLIGVVV